MSRCSWCDGDGFVCDDCNDAAPVAECDHCGREFCGDCKADHLEGDDEDDMICSLCVERRKGGA